MRTTIIRLNSVSKPPLRALRSILAGIALVALAAPLSAQDWTWRENMAVGQWLEIKGVIGSVRARSSTSRQVQVEAVKSARRSDPDEVEIAVVRHQNGVTICAVYPHERGRQPNECAPGDGGRMNTRNNDVNVEFVVYVPAGVNFIGRTVNGDVTITNLASHARAHTVNGSVRVTARSVAEASTVNGSIDVSVDQMTGSDPLEFQTVNGRITLELPAETDANVHASTVNGSITSDFPVTVRGRFGPKRLSGTIGRGGRDLSLTTVNGSIELRRK